MAIKIGVLGEKLTIQWLKSKSYCILYHSWHCRWGEIDIIAVDRSANTLVFVEVKTRSSGNWDSNGLEAISVSKQSKIIRSATLFLAEYSQYAEFYMRFDVALVKCQPPRKLEQLELIPSSPDFLVSEDGDRLRLIEYLENAFDAE